MVRKLPIVKINGKHYFRDDRLREFRNVNNPHDRVGFSETGNGKKGNGSNRSPEKMVWSYGELIPESEFPREDDIR